MSFTIDNKKWNLEKILRSGLFWTIIFPFFFFLIYASITRRGGEGVVALIIMLGGWAMFPVFFLAGLGLNTNLEKVSPIVYIVYIILYVLFLVLIRKVDKKKLYNLSIVVLIIALIGLRGCVKQGFTGF